MLEVNVLDFACKLATIDKPTHGPLHEAYDSQRSVRIETVESRD